MQYFFRLLCAALVLVLPLSAELASNYKPLALWLSWQNDPTTTMTIQWLSDAQNLEDSISYKKQQEEVWQGSSGEHCALPEDNPYLLHRIELKGLEPNSSYSFRIGKTNVQYLFRTMPQTLDEPLTFLVGGDTYQSRLQYFVETNKQAALQEPAFVLFGGDLAYATPEKESKPEDCERWLTWLKAWTDTMHTPKGYLVPLLVTIGNHEVKGRYLQTPHEAPFFYTLFPTPDNRCYHALHFGNYMAITFLDSAHTHAIEGEQTEWLAKELATQKPFLHRFALYHIPAYPSVRNFRQQYSAAIRRHWSPLFETFRLHAAFENHDHAYKRTYPLVEGDVNPLGVLYLGDGSWGTQPRIPKAQDRSNYLAKTASARQFIKVTISSKQREFWSITPQGAIIDHYVQLMPKT